MFSYPLSLCSRHDFRKVKKEYENLAAILARELHHWEDFIEIRSSREDLFKLVKDALPLKLLHRYSRRSVLKFICIDVLLAGIIIQTGFQ